ncbi:MAG: transporter [Hyphomonadaceae bacterium]
MRRIAATLGALLFTAALAHAEEPEFVSSRPGATEGAIAVPAGYWQVETEIASFARDRESGVKTKSWSGAATTLRYGLAHGADLELIVSPYVGQSVRDAGGKISDEGFGDVTLRARRTFAGQDGGAAFALIGYVTLPTAKDGLGAEKVEGGLIATGAVPLSSVDELAATLDLGAISENDSYAGDAFAAINWGHALSDRASVYLEATAERAAHDDETAATWGLGAAYLIGPATQIDAGANFALTDAADDASFFIGWAHRF